MQPSTYFASCARGIEPILEAELAALGIEVREARGGVRFSGPLEAAYRACLWSRTAGRILLPLGSFDAPDEEALYAGVRTIRWRDHLDARRTLAVDFTQVRSRLSHTQYGALKTKDAIVDQFRDELGTRPSIDPARPDVRVHVHVEEDRAEVAIDLSGESLHRRGYRPAGRSEAGIEAPLKENLAAAILLQARWPERARAGVPLVDPMCGSGTLLVEAALIAQDRAPGLGRKRFGLHRWLGHDPAIWERLLAEARERMQSVDPRTLPPIRGFDLDGRAVRAARMSVERAGVAGLVTVAERPLAELEPEAGAEHEPRGLIVTNPPYGERLGETPELYALYQELGDVLKRRLPGWEAHVLVGNLELAKAIGLRPRRRLPLYNGAIECRLLELPISPEPVQSEGPAWRRPRAPSPASEAFRNRLAKDLRHLRKWARRENVTCFRVYDADLPEYAVAVDLYEDAAHVQEYQAPATVDAARALERLHDVMAVVPEVLEVAPEQVFLKVRRRQRGLAQYERLEARGVLRPVHEGGHTFLVNLSDYLDTGLFLDHRRLRALVGELSPGRRFLNLFAYTGSATVYAARAGARATVSVDLSATYLDWARKNLDANRISGPHALERADVMAFLPDEKRRYGLILCAPPTFSNSKRMDGTFDVQRDHPALLSRAAALLEPDGVLLFSTHFRRFKLDAGALPGFHVEDITARTLPPDFARDGRTHKTFRITRR